MSQYRILLVEDDTELVDSLKLNLAAKGFQVDAATDGERGLSLALSGDYSLIVLDINLPGLDGLEVCKRIREKNRQLPILILSSQGEEIDKVVGLEVGADDHVTKPFRMSELVARLRALLRRSQVETVEPKSKNVLRFEELSIDLDNRHVTLAGEPIELTPLEYGLLTYLSGHPGRTFSRAQILQSVWQTNSLGYEHAVSNTAKRLRAKLDRGQNPPRYIQTVWGVGYRLGSPRGG